MADILAAFTSNDPAFTACISVWCEVYSRLEGAAGAWWCVEVEVEEGAGGCSVAISEGDNWADARGGACCCWRCCWSLLSLSTILAS